MSTTTSKKRSRISRGQSKLGCFTCKERKVKCDERKPTCKRCEQSRLVCEGYSSSADRFRVVDSMGHYLQVPDHDNLHDPGNEFSSGHLRSQGSSGLLLSTSNASKHLVQVGLDLLLGSYSDERAVGQPVLRMLILRYIPLSQAITTACAAIGAAHRLQKRELGSFERLNLTFETQYSQAITMVQQEITSQNFDPLALVISCVILTGIELIFRRRQDAMKHLRGAYQAIQSSLTLQPKWMLAIILPDDEHAKQGNQDGSSIIDYDVDTLLRTGDIHTLWFTNYTRFSALQPVSVLTLKVPFHNCPNMAWIDRKIVCLVHAALSFHSRVVHLAVSDTSTGTLSTERQQFVSLLQQWIGMLEGLLDRVMTQAQRDHFLILNNLCLSTQIAIEALSKDVETSWDAFTGAFQKIITSAEEILNNHHRWKNNNQKPTEIGFTTQISVLQPVYLAAEKCRDPSWRRRAICCLRRAEREGPWIGEMMAAIMECIMDIEESPTITRTPVAPYATQNNHHDELRGANSNLDMKVPEAMRISYVHIQEGNGAVNGATWATASSGTTVIWLLRRRKPACVLSVPLLTSAHFGTPETRTTHLSRANLDPDVWEVWQEWIEFSPGQRYRIVTPVSTSCELTEPNQHNPSRYKVGN